METNSAWDGGPLCSSLPSEGLPGLHLFPCIFFGWNPALLECKGKRYSGWRGLDEVLGTYIFHCPCQALYCLLSLVSQRWCFLKLPLIEGIVLQASSCLKFLAVQLFSAFSECQPGIFPMPGGKKGDAW